MRKAAFSIQSSDTVCMLCGLRALAASGGVYAPAARTSRRHLSSSTPSQAEALKSFGWGAPSDGRSKTHENQKTPQDNSEQSRPLWRSFGASERSKNRPHQRDTPFKGVRSGPFNSKPESDTPPIRKRPYERTLFRRHDAWDGSNESPSPPLEGRPLGNNTDENNQARDNGRPRWKHIQFRQDEDPGSPRTDAVRTSFTNNQEQRFDSAPGERAVTWGGEGAKRWEPRKPKQLNGDKSEKSEVRTRRSSRFDSRDSSGKQSLNNDFKRGKGLGRKDRYGVKNGRSASGDDMDDTLADRLDRREKRKANKKARKAENPPTPIILPDFISVGNLAGFLGVRNEAFLEKLQDLGFEELSNDHVLTAEDAGLIAQEFNFEPTKAPESSKEEDIVALPEPSAEEKELMLNRPPVITIMGHVDHGKTTLLDFLRKSSVAAGEHGGITQHIGAFTVNMPSGRNITFLDTPGHAAFLDMRARGANVTDIVILVVAADDSVKPQTLEAIKHANAAGVPMIVAITKVDKDQADVDRVKRDLAQHGVEVEDFGGDVQAIPVSGKTGQGMEDLEDAAVALADILDVRADTSGQVEGWVLESSMKRTGKVATVLVRRGTMAPGNIIVAGESWAKIRSLRNEAGQTVMEATPGQPVEVDGWDTTPIAGAEVLQAPSLQKARDVTEMRQVLAEEKKLAADVAATNEQRSEHRQQRGLAKQQEELDSLKQRDPDRAADLQAALDLAESNRKSRFIQVPIVLRADVAGSVEALSAAVLAIGNSEIRANILKAEVGRISESDIELAATAGGAIVNFGLPVDNPLRRRAEEEKIDLIDGNVIYRVTDEVKELLADKLPPLRTETVVGEADVAQIFNYTIKGKGQILVAGCKVHNGVIEKSKHFKVIRGGQTVHDGHLAALKSHKKDVGEIRKGNDCGMSFEDFSDFQEGDRIQCYDVIEEKRKL